MFALALVNVDADPPAPSPAPPSTPPPRRFTNRSTPTANPTHPTKPDRIDVDQNTHKTATRQRRQWSTSIPDGQRRDQDPAPANDKTIASRESPPHEDNVG